MFAASAAIGFQAALTASACRRRWLSVWMRLAALHPLARKSGDKVRANPAPFKQQGWRSVGFLPRGHPLFDN
jgi:hypothetical protein